MTEAEIEQRTEVLQRLQHAASAAASVYGQTATGAALSRIATESRRRLLNLQSPEPRR